MCHPDVGRIVMVPQVCSIVHGLAAEGGIRRREHRSSWTPGAPCPGDESEPDRAARRNEMADAKKQKVEQELEEIEAMFVQAAPEAAVEGSVLTLHDVSRSTLYFSDRPERVD